MEADPTLSKYEPVLGAVLKFPPETAYDFLGALATAEAPGPVMAPYRNQN